MDEVIRRYGSKALRKYWQNICYFSPALLILIIWFASTSASGSDNITNSNITSNNYKLLTDSDTKGTADGQLMFPHSISVASDGNAYVTDTGNKRIQKFSSDGKYYPDLIKDIQQGANVVYYQEEKPKSKLEELGKRLEQVSKGHFRKDLINKYRDGICVSYNQFATKLVKYQVGDKGQKATRIERYCQKHFELIIK
jgi:hypothetical protein